MMLAGQHRRNVFFDASSGCLRILDQTALPFELRWLALDSFASACQAITLMQVRGAPAIGAVAGWAMVFALCEGRDLQAACVTLKSTRPTAVNLAWAAERMLAVLAQQPDYARACQEAQAICDEDVAACSAIGDAGCAIIRQIAAEKRGAAVNILTHCNAGWLATVDWGTALAPVYKAHQQGIAVHVWVDETRPRNQGALLTAFELQQQGVPHTLICDNAGGHLMQQGQVDLCIVGSDRTAANGDVCNKIGTYLKALAAFDNGIPFYVALPVSTIDWQLASGAGIPIEQRDADEVLQVYGCLADGSTGFNRIAPQGTVAANPAFDVTPARLVTGLITEYGVFAADTISLQGLRQQSCNS